MRGLVLASGANKGAYEAGALLCLTKEAGYTFDMVAGTSVGAINAGFLAQFRVGEEVKAAEQLCAVWRDMSKKDVYSHWKPFSILHAFRKKGLLSSEPLRRTIDSCIDPAKLRQEHKLFMCSAVDWYSGETVMFDNFTENPSQAIYASAALPLAFPPVQYQGRTLLDGGIRDISPLQMLVEKGCTEIVVLAPDPKTVATQEAPTFTSIIGRTLTLALDEIHDDDISWCEERNINVQVIRPAFKLDYSALDFKRSSMKALLTLGYQDAKNHISGALALPDHHDH